MTSNPTDRKYFNADGEVDMYDVCLVIHAVVWFEFIASPKL